MQTLLMQVQIKIDTQGMVWRGKSQDEKALSMGISVSVQTTDDIVAIVSQRDLIPRTKCLQNY